MRSLTHARQRARACRDTIGASTDGLFERLRHYLSAAYEIELHSANQAFLQGGRAEVIPAEGCLFYDERLDDDPAAKLMVVLHEVGHLELHPRLHRRCTALDPVYGSMYLNDGAPALARYNRRAREEAEANAFATEFLCPSPEVFQQWRGSPDDTAPRIAQRLGVPISVVQAQLAEALYQMAMGDDGAAPEKSQRPLAGDESQRVAATFTNGPALVNAGPGTGKTATLVWRIAYLLEELGADPETLLVLTFSNDAAEELRQRIAAQFGAATASRMEISTFHGFGVTFLYHHGQFLGVDADAAILDETGQEELVTSLLGTVPCGRIITLYNPEETVRDIVRHIGYLKDRLYQPEHLAAALHAWHPTPDERQQYEATGEFLEVYRAYEAAKTARQRVDFADLPWHKGGLKRPSASGCATVVL